MPELCILGREIFDPHLDQLLKEKHKDQSRLQSLVYTVKMMLSMRNSFNVRLQYADKFNNFDLDVSNFKKSEDLWNSLSSIMPDLCQVRWAV